MIYLAMKITRNFPQALLTILLTGLFPFSQEAQGQSGEVVLESPHGLSPEQSEWIIERIDLYDHKNNFSSDSIL